MNIEIERKFLIKELPLVFEETIHIKQYYLSNNKNMVQRLRIFNKENAIMSFKEKTSKISKYEFEYNIPLEDANKMISIADVPFIDKKRHIIYIDSLKWEIDEFLDKNKGLIIAEVELKTEDQSISIPNWIDKEVTNDKKYYNYNLALKPYTLWL
ncbi:CYTH domain-containing protein [bacterium]|nr:CYTH domain-containing protein [bacterium]